MSRCILSDRFVGRAPFPILVLRNCKLVDQTDADTIARSHRMAAGFHGVVELEGVSRETRALLRRAGWTYNAGIEQEEK